MIWGVWCVFVVVKKSLDPLEPKANKKVFLEKLITNVIFKLKDLINLPKIQKLTKLM